MMNETKEQPPVEFKDFQEAIGKLCALEHGEKVYCWLRRRTEEHYRQTWGGELEGSSDVTCYMFELFKQQCHSGRNPRRILNDGFGFWMNGEICDIIGVPNCKATREYHNVERN